MEERVSSRFQLNFHLRVKVERDYSHLNSSERCLKWIKVVKKLQLMTRQQKRKMTSCADG